MNSESALPKSGHVHEVCKEWLVREDGALAYRLQSQEINEFYQGNKFRNAVVRQDFPTALHEQIKEKETAEQEAERYYKLLKEQEEADKCLAEKLASTLDKDEKEHLKQQLAESEIIAKELQEMYVNISATNNGVFRSTIPTSASSDSFSLPKISSIDNESAERFDSLEFSDNVICDRLEKLHCRPKNDIKESQRHHHKRQHDHYEQYFDDVTHNIRNADIQTTPKTTTTTGGAVAAFQQHPDYNFDNNRHSPSSQNLLLQTKNSPVYNNIDCNVNKDVVWSHHQQVPVTSSRKHAKSSGSCGGSGKNSRNVTELPLSPLQLNIPTDELGNINELGLTPEDFAELNKKLEQEKYDEELARHLQKEEQRKNLTQEEKDRLLAIEAQDKELAIMLQEREKLKAKRAKEKARLKKLQAKESLVENNSKLPPIDVNEPYSNPKDLITESQNFKFQHLQQKSYNFPPPPPTHPPPTGIIPSTIGNFDVTSDKNHNLNNDDNIYALPVDNSNHNEFDLRSSEEIMSTSMTSPRTILTSPSSLTGSYHQTESSPKPPYMPIHDIGNNLSPDGRKKKSKDKCTHQ